MKWRFESRLTIFDYGEIPVQGLYCTVHVTVELIVWTNCSECAQEDEGLGSRKGLPPTNLSIMRCFQLTNDPHWTECANEQVEGPPRFENSAVSLVLVETCYGILLELN
jgi:hypothetical protein